MRGRTMKVILNTDIENLGEEGDILDVSPGYARNYLLPKQLVSLHNRANLAILESRKKILEMHKEEKHRQALSIKERINSNSVEFRMPAGDNGKLFGAVTSQMIVDALKADDVIVERKRVEIPGHTLKVLGDYSIAIRLYGDEGATLSVKVLRESDEPKPAPRERSTLPPVSKSSPDSSEPTEEDSLSSSAPTEEDSLSSSAPAEEDSLSSSAPAEEDSLSSSAPAEEGSPEPAAEGGEEKTEEFTEAETRE